MLVAVISPETAEELKGKKCMAGSYFNPVEMGDKIVISFIEAQCLKLEDIVKVVEFEQPEEFSEEEIEEEA